MRTRLFFLVVIVFFAGCTMADRPVPDIPPAEAVIAAAANPDEGITGVFRLEVRNTAREGDWLILYSEPDPLDQRCLRIAVTDGVAKALGLQLGGDPGDSLKGRTLRVAGTARRTTTWLAANGVRSDKYFYQTLVAVSELSQISVLPDSPPAGGAPRRHASTFGSANPRGIRYVDYVPTPMEIKSQLESDGWKDVNVIREFPDYLQGPIRALGLFRSPADPPTAGTPQELGTIGTSHVEYLDLVLGTDGVVTAPIEFPDGAPGTTFHMAAKQHYVMIAWNPADRSGYLWRSLFYDFKGKATEVLFLIQRQDLGRI